MNIKELEMKQLLIFLLFIISNQAFSQTDQKAKAILDKVSEKTKSYTSITANFNFIMENAEVNLKETNPGTIIIQDKKYKLNINGIDIFCDGKSQWTYMPDAGEVNISEAGSNEEGALNPATIFTIYEEGFNYTYLGEFTNNSKQTYKIDLIPIEEKDFSRVILEVDQNTYQIVGAVMYGTDNNLYTILVKTMDTTKTYPATTFVFDTASHPDVDIIDMR